MNMKRMICILVAMILCFSGCGKQDTEAASTTETKQQIADITEPVSTTDPPPSTEETIPGLEDSEFLDETETSQETEPEATELDATEPEETDPEGSAGTEGSEPTEETPSTEPSQPSGETETEYQRFQNMSAADQQSFMDSFDSIEALFEWYNNAKAEHEAANPPIDVGDGNIDIGDIMG